MYKADIWDVNELDWDFSEPDSVLLTNENEGWSFTVTIEELEEISDSGMDKFIWADDQYMRLVQIGCAAAEDMLQDYKENWEE